MGQELRTKFHLSRNHALKTVIIKNILGVHSCITRASVNQVCHGVMSVAYRVSTRQKLPRSLMTLLGPAVTDVFLRAFLTLT